MTQHQLKESISRFHNNLKKCDVKCNRSDIEINMNVNYFTLYYENDFVVAYQEFSLTTNDEEVIPLYFNIDIEED